MLRIGVTELQAEVKRAQRAAKRGREICGILINENGHLGLLPVKNTASKCGAFKIIPSWCRISLRANAVEAGKIVGSYHSHPASSSEPGPGDIAGTYNGAYMLIIACYNAETHLWQVNNGKAFSVSLITRRT